MTRLIHVYSQLGYVSLFKSMYDKQKSPNHFLKMIRTLHHIPCPIILIFHQIKNQLKQLLRLLFCFCHRA